ncbi:MAG: class I SAM-dependent methyltransferase [Arenimonas sp.]
MSENRKMGAIVRENPKSIPLNTDAIDWANINLPDAWPDQIASNWRRLAMVITSMVCKKVQRVQLPEAMQGRERLPKYILQEFHHLPNGNYSKTISRGYANTFNKAMLGCMTIARAEIAKRLLSSKRVLDIGCGAGHLTGALQSAGIRDIWALEPSPYLLQHAARDYPGANFVQGVIENSELAAASFDGAAACFVFHEIPPPQANAALRELHRLLVPGAKLILVEPSPTQVKLSYVRVWRLYGWRGIYFRVLALRTHEPFVRAWHKIEPVTWFAANGFTLIEDRDCMPWRLLEARRNQN